MKFQKRIAPLLVVGVVLAACGGGSATASPGAPAASSGAAASGAAGGQIIVGLITKTDTNPFFVKMKEGAQAKATELGRQTDTLGE